MRRRVRTCWIAIAFCAGLSPLAHGQGKGPGDPPGGKSPSAQAQPRPADPRAAATLESARVAVAKLSSLAYTASISGPGVEVEKSDVFIKKADAGGWKIFARSAGDQPRLAAYDGLSVRAVDDDLKVVWDQSTEKIRDIRSVFGRRGLDSPVVWELLGDENWAQPEVALQSAATIDGVACEVITLRTRIELMVPPTAPGAPGKANAPDAANAPNAANGPGKQPQRQYDTSTGHEVRLFISKTDQLPRRIVRRAEGGPGAKPGPVTINISEIELEKAIPDAYFNVDTPSGYTVKAANPSPTPKSDRARNRTRHEPDPAAPAAFGLPIGEPAPEFTLKDADGRDHSLADYRGKVVILDFWGSWCPPCRAAMPGMQKLHEKYKDKPVAVLGLNFEQSPKADPAKFMKDNGFSYGLLLKAETIAGQYKIAGWPTFYILDDKGRVAWSAVGHSPEHEAQMSKVIDDLLSK